MQIKQKPDSDGYSFRGYGAVFGNVDSHKDIIQKGAFSKIIEEIKSGKRAMPRLMFSHEHKSIPVGKITSIGEDDHGLWIEAELTRGHSVAEDLKAAINHGTIEGLSIGYVAGETETKGENRLIHDFDDLLEISILNWQSNEQAKIDLASVKSKINDVTDVKGLETLFKDELNCSREVAKTLISKSKEVLSKEKKEAESEELKTLVTKAYLTVL